MIEHILLDEVLAAILIRGTFKTEGVKFFTPSDFSQQLGYMSHPKGYKIEPHIHLRVERAITLTQEVLLVKRGKVRVNFYGDDEIFRESRDLNAGDIILLASGGHGFEMLEDAEMIEIKQGPYAGDMDKLRFSPKKIEGK